MTTTSVKQNGGSGTSSSSSINTRPLSNEAVFRIELSFSSRKSSVIVMRCTARLYSLEGVGQKGAEPTRPASQAASGDAEWKSLAYGVPCIQLMRETTAHNSPFHIKLVIAEVESGIGLWECHLERGSKYNAMQNNFHTFSVKGKPHAVQFANEDEACRMLESVQDLLYQKEKAETVAFDGKRPDEAIFKKPKLPKKLNKKDISAPCNFKHVSGITASRTRTCEDELRGTIQRKIRSMSLSNLTSRKSKSRPQSEIVKSSGVSKDIQELDESPTFQRKGSASDGSKRPRSQSFMTKLRNPKKKQQHTPLTITEIQDDTAAVLGVGRFNRNSDTRRSLPSRLKKQPRPGLNENTFEPPTQEKAVRVLSPVRRTMSLSSGDVFPSRSHDQPARPAGQEMGHSNDQNQTTPTTTTATKPQAKSSFNYTPYSKSMSGTKRKSVNEDSAHHYQDARRAMGGDGRQYMSEQNLHGRNMSVPGGVAHAGQRHSRGSYHEAQIPSTVHEVPHVEMLEGNVRYQENRDWSNWSQTMPRLHSTSWKTQSIPEIARAPGHGQEGVVNPSQAYAAHQQGRMGVAGEGVATQRPNGYHPIGQQPANETHPHAMSAQDMTSLHNYDPATGFSLPLGVAPPPPAMSPSHVTTAQGGLPQIPEVQGRPHAHSQSRVSGARMESGQPLVNQVVPNSIPQQNVMTVDRHIPLNPAPSQRMPIQVAAPHVPANHHPHMHPSQATPTQAPMSQVHPAPGAQTVDNQRPLAMQVGATSHHWSDGLAQVPKTISNLQMYQKPPSPNLQRHAHQAHMMSLNKQQQHPGPHYSRGHTMTMTTASQQISADTQVSPSHSQSKVSPISVQGGHIGNGTVKHGFNSVPAQSSYAVHHNPVPILIQAPLVPPTQTRLQNVQTDIVNGDKSASQHPPPGPIQATPPHYKAVMESPNLRLHPPHGHHPAHPANTSFDGNDSLASHSTISMDADMSAYTEQMSRALEQFDSLLTKKPSIIQTSF